MTHICMSQQITSAILMHPIPIRSYFGAEHDHPICHVSFFSLATHSSTLLPCKPEQRDSHYIYRNICNVKAKKANLELIFIDFSDSYNVRQPTNRCTTMLPCHQMQKKSDILYTTMFLISIQFFSEFKVILFCVHKCLRQNVHRSCTQGATPLACIQKEPLYQPLSQQLSLNPVRNPLDSLIEFSTRSIGNIIRQQALDVE